MEPRTSIRAFSRQKQDFCAQAKEEMNILVHRELTLAVA